MSFSVWYILLNISIYFIRSNFDYGNFFYDQSDNYSSLSKKESVQYNAALAITGEM